MNDNCYNIVTYQAEITATGTSQQVLGFNQARAYLMIYNLGSDFIKVKFGSDFSGSENGMRVYPGVSFSPLIIPLTSIYIKSNSGSQTVYVKEGQRT